MEILITLTDFLILGLLLTFPVLLLIILNRLKTKWTLIAYSIISLFVLGLIIIFFAWWSYKSDLILLKHYGYNIDGMNYTEFYGNVAPDNMEKVKSLETSIMGIGWPLKAYFGYLLFIPYLIIVYIGKILIKRLKKNKNEA
ncbi:MAG: hypothetical protein E4G71_00835 [Candidatus Atribacteria bacterium]|nr:MAG: hypothetical protein E4G71_00835 [Candidatus Atribacteria bacterium]